MAAKTPLEMAAQSLVEISHMQRESIDALGTKFDHFAETVTHNLAELTAAQTKLTQTVDRLSDRIDNLAMVQQSQQLIVADLVALAQSQQAMFSQMLAKN